MTKQSRMTLGYWIPLIGWMLTIFILSSIPGRNIPHVSVLGFDKVAHIFIYGILGLFLIRAFFSATDIGLVKSVLLSIIIGALFGMSDEWHQSFVPGRNMDLFDFFADFIGLSVGVFLRCKGKWYAGN